MTISNYIKDFYTSIIAFQEIPSWELTEKLVSIIIDSLPTLDDEYKIQNNIAIHRSAKVSPTATLYGPIIICSDAMIGENAMLRNGVIIGKKTVIGHSSEIKQSIVFNDSSIAHFNFVGNSIIGNRVNIEAGVVCCNHYNERAEKTITVLIDGKQLKIPAAKFGSVIGDDSKIGANSVLSPGTILLKNSVIGRLQLTEQNPL